MDSSSEILITQICEIKYLWVIIHLDIGFYIKEFCHDNVEKGAICCA